MTSLLSDTNALPSLLSKRTWKPSSLELAVLQNQFEKDNTPSRKDKNQLLQKLNSTFGADCSIAQIENWFQVERSHNSKRVKTETPHLSYHKFTAVDIKFLSESFELNNYPEMEEMEDMADKLGVSLSKIENWYKHHRRSLAKKGKFYLKTKKYFKQNEVNFLMSHFRKNSRPSPKEISVIAKEANCTELQIKNWYSNKRKKFRHLDQVQKGEAFISSEKILPQVSSHSSYGETNSSLPSDSEICLKTNLFSSNPLLYSPQEEQKNSPSLSTEKCGLLENYMPKIISQGLLPASGHFSSSLISTPSIQSPQDHHTSLLRFAELRKRYDSINAFTQNQFQAQKDHFSTQRNNQLNHIFATQNPVSLNTISIYQNFSQTQIQLEALKPLLIDSLQTVKNNASIFLNAPKENIQDLILKNLMARNVLIQAQQSMC